MIGPFSLAKVKAAPCGPTIEAELASLRHRTWSLGSPSQISMYRSCERKWWFRQLGGLFTPSSPAQQLGVDVHADLGAMLVTGHAPEPAADPERQRAQEIALAGYSWLRARPGGVPLVDPADLSVARALYVVSWPVPVVAEIDWLAGPRSIVDFKTSSTKLSATNDDLLTDPQAVIYSAAACSVPSELRPPVRLGRPGAERVYLPAVPGQLEPVDFGLLHIRTKGPMTVETVSAVLTPETIGAGLDGIGATLRSMRETATAISPRDVRPNASACYEFGPCPFIAHCKFLGDRDVTTIPNPFARPAASASATILSPETTVTTASQPDGATFIPPRPGLVIVARVQQAAGKNRNAARPQVKRESHDSATALEIEAALVGVFGPYRHRGDSSFALLEHARMKTPWGDTSPSVVRNFIDANTAELVEVPSLSEVAAYVLGSVSAAIDAGYGSVEFPAELVTAVDTETLPALTSEEKFGPRPAPLPSRLAALNAASRPEAVVEAAPEAAPAPKPARSRECIPTHDAIPARWRGHLRAQLSSQIVGACRNELALACRAAGHDVPLGAPSTLRRDQIAEVAAFVALLTGVRPWGDDDDRPAPAAPAAPAAAEPSPAAPATAPEAPPAPPAPAPAINIPKCPPESPSAPADAGGRLLFVDCRPRAGDYTELADLMAPLYRWVEAERKVAHYMVLPYGEGPKLAAAGLHHALRSGDVTLPPRLVVLRSTPGAAEALVELSAFYARDQIVEGTR